MKKVLRVLFGVVIAIGVLLVLGAAGNDCDGKCMENALPIGELMLFILYGFAMIGVGAFGLAKLND
jgi:hypothetical protein